MPDKHGKAERLLEDALDALVRALTQSGAPWMIIGGIALIARGVHRFTTDIDAAVRGDAIRPEELLAVLGHHGIAPRIPEALSFAEENLVLLLRHEATSVDLDVSFAWSAFEHDALAACTPARFGSVTIPTSTPEDLVVFKAIAGRPKDVDDAEALLLLYPKVDVGRVRRRVAELSALAEAPELLEAFDTLAARVRQAEVPASHLGNARSSRRAPRGRRKRG